MRLVVVLVLLAACGDDTTAKLDAACSESVLYLNRSGGMFVAGTRDSSITNVSELVDMPRMLPPFPHDDLEWASLQNCIRTTLQPFTLRVTETDPSPAPHAEIVFTTTYWAGIAGQSMIAPSACRSGNQVMFVFGSATPTYARACHVALMGYAQMTAQLSLADNCMDVVNDEADCIAMRTFVDATATCVGASNQPTQCRCGGTTQNSYQALRMATPVCP